MSITQSTIGILLKDQSGACWKCGRSIPPFEVHHAVYSRDMHFQKYLDMAENLILVCPYCHANHGALANFPTRKKVWQWKVEHGYEIKAWHEKLDMLIKDNLDGE